MATGENFAGTAYISDSRIALMLVFAGPLPFALPKMVICTCSNCITKHVVINGVRQPGCSVSTSTRLEHKKKASKVFQAAVKPSSRSSNKPSPPVEKVKGTLLALNIHCIMVNSYLELTLETSSIVKLCCTLVIWLN